MSTARIAEMRGGRLALGAFEFRYSRPWPPLRLCGFCLSCILIWHLLRQGLIQIIGSCRARSPRRGRTPRQRIQALDRTNLASLQPCFSSGVLQRANTPRLPFSVSPAHRSHTQERPRRESNLDSIPPAPRLRQPGHDVSRSGMRNPARLLRAVDPPAIYGVGAHQDITQYRSTPVPTRNFPSTSARIPRAPRRRSQSFKRHGRLGMVVVGTCSSWLSN